MADARFTNYTNWDDLRFPVQGINPPGAVSDPDVSTTTGLLLFDASTVEIIAGVAQMPHTWKEGSAIRPHIHWWPSSGAAGNVVWRFEYEIVEVGDVPTGTYTAIDVTAACDAGKSSLTSFGEIDMTGKQISALILWKLSRRATDVADTYAADAVLAEFDIHYQIDSLGSGELFTKVYLSELV